MFIGSIERLTVSSGEAYQIWELISFVGPRLYHFLMVPITSSEILFFGGGRDGETTGEVSVLNLEDLTRKVVINDQNYRFKSLTNTYSLTRSGLVTAAVERPNGTHDLISYSTQWNKIRVLAKDLDSREKEIVQD